MILIEVALGCWLVQTDWPYKPTGQRLLSSSECLVLLKMFVFQIKYLINGIKTENMDFKNENVAMLG